MSNDVPRCWSTVCLDSTVFDAAVALDLPVAGRLHYHYEGVAVLSCPKGMVVECGIHYIGTPKNSELSKA